MKVLYVTNMISHHQLPVARCIVEKLGEKNFRFVATEQISADRIKLGWNSDETEPWIIKAAENTAYRSQFEKWWDDADVVICGERRFDRMSDRLKNGLLTFYMSERWWKPPIGMARMLSPKFMNLTMKFSRLQESNLFHYMPMGSYASEDIRRIVSLKGRMWQWGYMTDVSKVSMNSVLYDNEYGVLWVGRMLAWKRVDTLIHAYSIFQRTYPESTLTLVGDGPERIRLERLAKNILPQHSYTFIDAVSANKVLEIMSRHKVYVLPSSGYEGWGAVLNEAMSSNCAVIASDSAGASKLLIEHGENGLLFKQGDSSALAKYLVFLKQNEYIRTSIAARGKKTIDDLWSPNVAVERLLSVCDSLLTKKEIPIFKKGPMVRL